MKRLPYIAGLLIAFALGAASFALGQSAFLGQSVSASDPAELVREIAIEDEICDVNNDCEIFRGNVSVNFAEADGLPSLSPDMAGLYLDYSGDIVRIGTGEISVEVSIEQINDNAPVTAVSATHNGPELEIIVNAETQIFADITPHSEPDIADFEAGSMLVQREVAAGDLAELANLDESMMIRAWGSMQGDALLAQYLVYEPIR